jgi:FkbM family methyltransferase
MKFNPMRYRIPLLKRAVPSLKKRLAQMASMNGFQLKKAQGAVFLLRSSNYVDRQIAFYGDYEHRQLGRLLAAMRQSGCDLFIDVGANIGLYTVVVGRSGAAAEIIAFEPDQRNRLQLGANLLLNHLTGIVTIRPEAVTSRSGTIGFRPSPDTSTGQSAVGSGEGSITVAAVALDDAVASDDRRIFIKIDIEGHELEAIRGMPVLLQHNRIFLQVECFEANVVRLAETMAAMGLRQRDKIEDDYFFANF